MTTEEELQNRNLLMQIEALQKENAGLKESLRDRFAMSVLTGISADSELDMTFEFMAETCYKQADAMLEARK